MNTASFHRPEWEIDKQLQSLIGENVRVAVESFSPHRWNGEAIPRLIHTADIFLPDNSQPEGVPVFFEGRLQRFERRVGVVYVLLESPKLTHQTAHGLVYFRGKTAVILCGPATVRLAAPHVIERLPAAPQNYWNDLRLPRVQLELGFLTASEE